MNYYIQGDATKAKQIRAAFEELGINVLGFGFADKAVVYCSIGECVQYLPYSINLMNILYSHPDYKELELPVEPKFKVGDWIVRGSGFIYEPSLITEIRDYYICELQNGEKVTFTLNDVHKNFHLWSIADAKDGDIIGFNDCTHNDGSYIDWVGIYKQEIETNQHLFHCVMPSCRSFRVGGMWRVFTAYPATKEQRDMLFAKMKEAGYTWDVGKKELRKIKPHYDIKNFHAGMPVLVRDNNKEWRYVPFSHITNGSWKFNAVGTIWEQCIPFKGNEHLLGTTDMPDECYINW